MDKFLICVLIYMSSFAAIFAQRVNQKIIDSKTQKEILYGKCNIDGLKSGEFGDIFKTEYKYYIPDSIILSQMKPLLKKIKIQVVMGTWCGDSQQQIPRFIKILDIMGYKTKKLDILCIDHFFKAKNFEKGTNKIEKIPTFIIYYKHKEIGRIIESPTQTLEKDLLDILREKNKFKISLKKPT